MIIDQVTILFQKGGLIHADLSPYNILIKDDTPFLIDMSQSVLISHPRADEFLKRDLHNILTFFSLKGVDTPELDELLLSITSTPSEETKKGKNRTIS